MKMRRNMRMRVRSGVATLVLGSGLSASFASGTFAQTDATSQLVPVSPPAIVVQAPSVPATKQERWYVVMMQDQRAGWIQSKQETIDNIIKSSSRTELKIKRGPIAIPITVTTEFLETTAHKPISMSVSQKLGAMATTTKTVFLENEVEVTSAQGSNEIKTRKPLPGGNWLTPGAVDAFVKAQIASGVQSFEVRTIDPSVGDSVLTITRSITGRKDAEVFGRVVPAIEWVSTIDKFPGIKQRELVDEAGDTVRGETELGGIAITQLLADKELALRPLDAPELLESTTVTPSRPISNPRELREATYRLSVKTGKFVPLESTAGQVAGPLVEETNSQDVVVTAAGVEQVAAADLASMRTKYLTPTTMINNADQGVIDLVKKIKVDKDVSVAQRAEAARRFVHGFINKKDMSVGFASASEVCRTKQGDCTEHAVLLAAVLKAQDIPARVVSGLIYVDEFAGQKGIFGYHMWTQALLDGPDGTGQWKNLDATLSDQTPYDAAHIAIATSDLSDSSTQNFMVTTAPLIGRLQIEVLTTTP
jgi:hypothetical protein